MIDPNLDVAGGFPLDDVMSAKALTGIDDQGALNSPDVRVRNRLHVAT
jgi:hypothetical protein